MKQYIVQIEDTTVYETRVRANTTAEAEVVVFEKDTSAMDVVRTDSKVIYCKPVRSLEPEQDEED